ncbi:MAG: Universal stress protein [Burkholderia sp.]|jgi:nucleotide-binding universal stress UspA family protein
MYKRILVPTDGSEMSGKALDAAARFAKPLGASLVIVNVVEPYSYTNLSEYRPESIEQYDERVSAEAEDLLANCKRRCDELGVAAKTVMVKSFSPADAIIEQSKKNDCDIVFMASHGRQGFAAVLLGSETQKVLTHSTIPVMVYR